MKLSLYDPPFMPLSEQLLKVLLGFFARSKSGEACLLVQGAGHDGFQKRTRLLSLVDPW